MIFLFFHLVNYLSSNFTINMMRRNWKIYVKPLIFPTIVLFLLTITIILLEHFTGIEEFAFGFIIIIPAFVILLIWSDSIKKEKRATSNIALLAELQKRELIRDKEKILVKVIKPILEEKKATNINIKSDYPPKITCFFTEESEWKFIKTMNVVTGTEDDIKIESIFVGDYPFSLSIRPKKDKQENDELEDYLAIYSTHSLLINKVSSREEIKNLLFSLSESLKQISINGKFLSAYLYSAEKLPMLMELISIIYNDIVIEDYGETDVEELLCYQCNEIFNKFEEECDTCGAPRPTCKVCILDLKISEKKDVVKTPCCETYAHKDHMIAWLEESGKCPNCKKDLFLWLRTLKKQ